LTADIHAIKAGISNCYLVKDKGGAILVDAGPPGEIKALVSGLARAGVKPEGLNAAVVTHCHWDHIGSLNALKEVSRATVIVQQRERHALENGERLIPPGATLWGRLFGWFLKGISAKMTIVPCDADIAVGETDYSLQPFGIEATIVYTPGHTSGSVSVLLDNGAAFVGDSAMNGLPLTLGPNLPIFAEDMRALRRSWQTLLKKGARTIYPGHGKPFPAAQMRGRLAPFMDSKRK